MDRVLCHFCPSDQQIAPGKSRPPCHFRHFQMAHPRQHVSVLRKRPEWTRGESRRPSVCSHTCEVATYFFLIPCCRVCTNELRDGKCVFTKHFLAYAHAVFWSHTGIFLVNEEIFFPPFSFNFEMFLCLHTFHSLCHIYRNRKLG